MSQRAKLKGRRDKGGFMLIHHDMLKHPNYISLSKDAKLIFVFLKSQYRGHNNGDLSATLNMVKSNGYGSSSAQLSKALKELVDKEFIIKTRQGGKNKCNLFAITCESIDDGKGKHDFRSTKVASNEWRNINS